MTEVITRFAPSPTGFLHIGGARTALFNWLYARHTGGKFLLRVEDTDKARSTKEAVDALLQGLKWLGLDWDEEPMFQSAREARHAEVAKQLVDEDKAYYCYTSQAELDAFRAEHPNQKFQSPWRDGGTPPDGVNPVIRIKAPQSGQITVHDYVRGSVSVDAKELDDMVLLRGDGTPTYMLAVVVDDHDMGVTHAIRGDDHFTNKFRQLLIYHAMGWEPPKFAHVPLIHGADGAKLSKRHGATGVEQYEAMGYLPEAMRNYLLRLGWSHGDQEIFSDEQAIQLFDFKGLGKSPSRFDIEKLNSVNHHYMKIAAPERLVALIFPPPLRGEVRRGAISTDAESAPSLSLPLKGEGILLRALPWLVDRANTLVDLKEQAAFLLAPHPLTPTEKAAEIVATSEAKAILKEISVVLENVSDWQEDVLKATCNEHMSGHGLKPKQFMPVMRAALSGKEASAGSIYQIMQALGREETIARIKDIK